jgi:hypothetical protein
MPRLKSGWRNTPYPSLRMKNRNQRMRKWIHLTIARLLKEGQTRTLGRRRSFLTDQ